MAAAPSDGAFAQKRIETANILDGEAARVVVEVDVDVLTLAVPAQAARYPVAQSRPLVTAYGAPVRSVQSDEGQETDRL